MFSSIPTSGSPDSDPELPASPSSPAPVGPSRFSLRLLLIAVLAVGLALYIGSQVIGVLFSIVMPPQPPRPADVEQIEHTSASYGVDEWIYAVNQDACAVAAYYQAQGASCSIAPEICSGESMSRDAYTVGENVAQCSGEMKFSIFAMKWNAVIAAGYREGLPTRFRLSREIFWSGEIPPANFFDRQPTPVPAIP